MRSDDKTWTFTGHSTSTRPTLAVLDEIHSHTGATASDWVTGYWPGMTKPYKPEPDPVKHKLHLEPIDNGWAGYKPVCEGCKWTGPIKMNRTLAQREADAHLAAKQPNT